MKARDWRDFLEAQDRLHHKRLYCVAELANVANRSHHATNVELHRLVRQGVLVRYAKGIYGRPGTATVEDLAAAMDDEAYVTGHSALFMHNLVTQVPATVTCFTSRRHNRSRVRMTPLGRFVFTCVRRPVYAPPPAGGIAPPEQALCDFIYLSLRTGIVPGALVTWRNLDRLDPAVLDETAHRYPRTVAVAARALAGKFTKT